MQDGMEQVARKVVVGLRQVAADSVAIDAGTHSDRINGYATELAQAIGYVEASPELLAAREMAAGVVGRVVTRDMQRGQNSRIRMSDDVTMPAQSAVQGLLVGKLDDCDIMQDMLVAIERGRTLAAIASARQQTLDMMSAPRETRTVPDRLTITIDGPQGSGKTTIGDFLCRWFPLSFSAAHSRAAQSYDPLIIEMRDGRPFDVRGDAFLDGMEG